MRARGARPAGCRRPRRRSTHAWLCRRRALPATSLRLDSRRAARGDPPGGHWHAGACEKMGMVAVSYCMSARLFEWSDLEIFLAVTRGGTLAAAAESLLVDASTVQRRVGKLEGALRTRLFDRSPRGYSLTAAGEDLLAHARQMEHEAIAAQRKLVARDDSL